jgi:ATP-dependent DNA helicase RecG
VAGGPGHDAAGLMSFDLDTPVQFLKGVGPQRAKAFEKVGVRTAEDLLLRLPLRYEDRSRLVPLAELHAGQRVSVVGEIVLAGLRRARRMAILELRIDDGTGRLKAVFFNQPYLQDVLERGRRVILYGTVERDPWGGQLQMNSPEHEVLDPEEEGPGLHAGRVVPIYERVGLVTGKVLRRLLTALAGELPAEVPDPLPPEVRARLGVIPRAEALRRAHVPPADEPLEPLNRARSAAHVRLILEELFLFQLGLVDRRRGRRAQRKGVAFTVDDRVREAVRQVLPFKLTGAQKRVLKEIADDMRAPSPMHRLLQGDVGSGKTVVALLASVVAMENGCQAAFMAPTEILAEQHFLSLKRMLARQPYVVELFTSSLKGKARKAARERLEKGEVHLAVGTHALIQEDLRFRKLGLAIVDEQHRFGVLQREDLMRKGVGADVLVMTATPIPRTLALTAYGDLDTSVIDERPPGRTPIRTELRLASDRRGILAVVQRELEAGHQAYVIYPLVQESEKLEDVRAATQMREAWQAALPGRQVGLLHGRLKAPEKEAVMAAFAAGAIHVLVATTVVEVGVDVPNATVIVIEHAERFGLAQLHQLRGRVGRGRAPSTCVLVAHGKPSLESRQRLQALVQTDDGFRIAETDLSIRGPGDFFGTRQWGMPELRVSDLVRDRDLLERARAEAERWVDECAARPGKDPLRHFVESGAWQRRFGLAEVG